MKNDNLKLIISPPKPRVFIFWLLKSSVEVHEGMIVFMTSIDISLYEFILKQECIPVTEKQIMNCLFGAYLLRLFYPLGAPYMLFSVTRSICIAHLGWGYAGIVIALVELKATFTLPLT